MVIEGKDSPSFPPAGGRGNGHLRRRLLLGRAARLPGTGDWLSPSFTGVLTGIDGLTVWRLLKMKNGGIFWPNIYMDGECHKVQEKHFENGF